VYPEMPPHTGKYWLSIIYFGSRSIGTSHRSILSRISYSEPPGAHEQKQEYKNKEQNGAIIIKNIAEYASSICHSKHLLMFLRNHNKLFVYR